MIYASPSLVNFAGFDGGIGLNGLSLANHADLLLFSLGEDAADHCAPADPAVLADDGMADNGLISFKFASL